MKSWQDSANQTVNSIFNSFYPDQFSSAVDSISKMSDYFDFVLLKTDGLNVLTKSALSTREGLSIWEYLSHRAIEALYSINHPVDSDFILNVLISKQKDYGPNNIARFGTAGILIRMHDKIARLLNLLKRSDNNFNTATMINAVQDESIADTLVDIIGYSVIAIMWTTIDVETDLPEFLLPMM